VLALAIDMYRIMPDFLEIVPPQKREIHTLTSTPLWAKLASN
jgi:hypothetical protein